MRRPVRVSRRWWQHPRSPALGTDVVPLPEAAALECQIPDGGRGEMCHASSQLRAQRRADRQATNRELRATVDRGNRGLRDDVEARYPHYSRKPSS